jgi:hypothetical protein
MPRLRTPCAKPRLKSPATIKQRVFFIADSAYVGLSLFVKVPFDRGGERK